MSYGMTDEQVALARQVVALPGFGTGVVLLFWRSPGGFKCHSRGSGGSAPFLAWSMWDGRYMTPSKAILDVADPGNAARLMEMTAGEWSCESTAGGGWRVSLSKPSRADTDRMVEVSASTLCEAVCRVLVQHGRVA